jgi:type IV secretory pathway VirB10-like protein
MKQCPACGESFDDAHTFCDLDGAVLTGEEELLRESLVRQTETLPEVRTDQKPSSAWAIGVGGVFVGVILCAIAYLVLMWPSRTNQPEPVHQSARTKEIAAAQPPRTVAAPAPLVSPLPSPAEEISLDPDAQAAATPIASTSIPKVSANLNEQSVSTGEKTQAENKHTLILMKDGSSVEADAAWQDSQGVWYRRSGLVSFVESNRVERITEATQTKAGSAEAAKP